MSYKTHNEKGVIYATIWPGKRRVLLAGPVPVSAFAADSLTMQMLFGICGSDAVADWRRDLGMT